MNLEMIRVDRSLERLLRTILGYYCHDMAEYFQINADEDGTYSYPIDEVWSAGRDVHIAYLDHIPIGFALVGSADGYVEPHAMKEWRDSALGFLLP